MPSVFQLLVLRTVFQLLFLLSAPVLYPSMDKYVRAVLVQDYKKYFTLKTE